MCLLSEWCFNVFADSSDSVCVWYDKACGLLYLLSVSIPKWVVIFPHLKIKITNSIFSSFLKAISRPKDDIPACVISTILFNSCLFAG